MDNKNKIREFFNFNFLVTESILKYFFIAVTVLSVMGAVVGIFASWIGAFAMIRYNFAAFLVSFVGMPIVIVIGTAFYFIFLRIAFESILIRFLTYREVKQINDKTNTMDT